MRKAITLTLCLACAVLSGAQAQPQQSTPGIFLTGQVTGFDGAVYSLTLQNDDKLLVAGLFDQFQTYSAQGLMRLNPDGSPDAGFMSSGQATAAIVKTLVQPDGKIWAGGAFTQYNGQPASRLVRLMPDGHSDPEFSTGSGFAAANNCPYLTDMVLQADGRLVVAGHFSRYNGLPSNGLVRLLPDGSPDESFATGTGFDSPVRALLVQPDGRLVAVGDFRRYNGVTCNGLIRLHPDGSIDHSLASGAGFAFNPGEGPQTVALTENGRLLVAGSFSHYDNKAVGPIIQLDRHGKPDKEFSATSLFATNAAIHTLLPQPNGKVIFAGSFTIEGTARSGIGRLNPDGTLDPEFNPNGSGPDGRVNALALQPDGKILAGGTFTSYNHQPSPYFARLLPDGTYDAHQGLRAGNLLTE